MCDFFLLSKQLGTEISNNETNKFVNVDGKVYILPKNNISYYINHGLFEKNLIEWSRQFCKKDQNFLDIGAHSGTYSVSLADSCNQVYAFEPQKMTYYTLCGSVALSNIKNIKCLNYGLGAAEQVGKQTLNIVSLDGGGSTLHEVNKDTILETEEIEVRTLDSFNIDNISFIKMDVEGNELQVLTASRNTLERSNYPKIIFEMNVINTELVDFLEKMGYNVIPINNVSNMFLAVYR